MKSRIALLLVPLLTITARGALIPLGQNSPYLQDFNYPSLARTGSENSLLPRGWSFFEMGRHHDNHYAANSGTADRGDTYSFGSLGASDRAFGTLRDKGFSSIIGASFQNTSDSSINRLNISYTGEEWRLGTAGRLDRLDFQYSLDASSLTTGTWIDANALDFVTPNTVGVGAHNGNSASNRRDVSGSISFLNIPAGGTFWIRWTDFDALGNDDGLAIDNFSIVAVPEAGTWLAAVACVISLAIFFKRHRRLFCPHLP